MDFTREFQGGSILIWVDHVTKKKNSFGDLTQWIQKQYYGIWDADLDSAFIELSGEQGIQTKEAELLLACLWICFKEEIKYLFSDYEYMSFD